MKSTTVLFCFFGLLSGLILGFTLANSINRSYSTSASIPSAPANVTGAENIDELSGDEIRRALESANSRADDADLQLQIGLALYQYAKSQRDVSYLSELEKILKRAEKNNSQNFDLLIALGEITFVRAQETKQTKLYQESGDYFQRALGVRPASVQTQINLASVFLFSEPAEPEKAIQYLEKVLVTEPRNEIARVNLINALLRINRFAEAQKRFSELQQLNPENPALPDLQTQLTQKKIG